MQGEILKKSILLPVGRSTRRCGGYGNDGHVKTLVDMAEGVSAGLKSVVS